MKTTTFALRAAGVALALSLCLPLQGCFPLMAGAMVGSVMVAADRRPTTTQAVDRTTEIDLASRIGKRFDDRTHVNVNIYNRRALLTGEVKDAATRGEVERLVRGTANIRDVFNDIALEPVSSMGKRADDAYLAAKVRSELLAAKGVPSEAMRVVVEAKIVYLMGVVTEDEGRRAAEITSGVGGARRVVKLFDYITDDEKLRLDGGPRDGGGASTESGAGRN